MRPHTTGPALRPPLDPALAPPLRTALDPAPDRPALVLPALPAWLTLPFVVLFGLIPLLSAWPAAAAPRVSAPGAGTSARDGRVWPVGAEAGADRPTVLRGWEPPPTPWAAGHRGVDLAARTGRAVRAAAAGQVSFAGPVAGRGVLTIELSGTGLPPLRTTYEPVRAVVAKGERVRAGEVVGVLGAGRFHCPSGCLHWGLRRGDRYLDPLSLLAPSMLGRGPSRLLPVFGVPEGLGAQGQAGAPDEAGAQQRTDAPPGAGAPAADARDTPYTGDGRMPYALASRTAGPSGPVDLASPAVLAVAAAWAGVRLRRARATGAGRVVLRGAPRAGPW